MRTCLLCGREYSQMGYYCPSCYAYLRVHPEGLYPQPREGEVLYAKNGDPVCHICRKAFSKLGGHIVNCHHMTQKEYREKFKLHHCTRLSNDKYIEKMRNYTMENYDVVILENLIVNGTKTRITPNRKMPKRTIGNGCVIKTQC